jgi:nitrogen fixation NifU-like protein
VKVAFSDPNETTATDPAPLLEMLASAGYSEKAISYIINRPNMGQLPDADQVTEVTGECGDTMKVYLQLEGNRIKNARFQVLGCPGAVASAMVAADLVKGKTLQESRAICDRDIFCALDGVPDRKLDCIRLAVKTLQKAIADCPLPKD